MSFKKHVVLVFLSVFFGYGGCCTFPADLQNGTWITNDMGEVTFTANNFTVEYLASFGSMTFQCITKTSVGGGAKRYYAESIPFLYLGSNSLKASMCFELKKMTEYKYSYYLLSDVLANTDVNRIILEADTYAFSAAETCSLTTTLPTQARLFVRLDLLDKAEFNDACSLPGSENVTASNCSNAISKIYTDYNVTSNSSFSCNETTLNVCDDRTQLVFNYTMCSDVMTYSAGGQLYCMWDYQDGDTLYTLLYNQDATTDESTYYRFTCMVSQTINDNTTYISTYPRACLANQTANETASSVSQTVVLYANYSCPDEPVTTISSARQSSEEVLAAGAAAAIVLGLIILITAAVVIGAWYYIKVHKKKKIQPDSEKLVDGKPDPKADDKDGFIPAKSPPINTNINDEKSGRVSPFSPYPTVSELACYRFGPEPATVEIDDDDGGMTLEATTPGLTEGQRTKYEMKDNESVASLPVYSEFGDPTPDPTRLSEVQTVMSEFTITDNDPGPQPFTMTRATMNIPEENTVSPIGSPRVPV